MNGISMKLRAVKGKRLQKLSDENTYSDINDVEANTTHVLLSTDTFLGCPLECSDDGILDFVEILHSLGDIDDKVGASSIGTETPNLSCIGDIPTEFIGKDTGTELEIVTGVDLS